MKNRRQPAEDERVKEIRERRQKIVGFPWSVSSKTVVVGTVAGPIATTYNTASTQEQADRNLAIAKPNADFIAHAPADIDYLLSLLPVQPAQQVKDGISWSALLAVLERLRSKNRNPEREWYHGWNAAIQCLINDIYARAGGRLCLESDAVSQASTEAQCPEPNNDSTQATHSATGDVSA